MNASTVPISAVERLRSLADWLQDHPTAEATNLYADGQTGKVRVLDCKMTQTALEYAARTIGGHWTIDMENEWYRLRQEVSPGVEYILFASHKAVPVGIHCWNCGAVPNIACCEMGRMS